MTERKRTSLSEASIKKIIFERLEADLLEEGERFDEEGKEFEWAWEAVAFAGRALVRLQQGHWELSLREIIKIFGMDAILNGCAIIKGLCDWQEAEERQGQTTPWSEAKEALQVAKDGSPKWTAIHVKEARDILSDSLKRKRALSEQADGSPPHAKLLRHDLNRVRIHNVGSQGARVRSSTERTNSPNPPSSAQDDVDLQETRNIPNAPTLLAGPSPYRDMTRPGLPNNAKEPSQRHIALAVTEVSEEESQTNQDLYDPPTPIHEARVNDITAVRECVAASHPDENNTDENDPEENDLDEDVCSVKKDLCLPPSMCRNTLDFLLERLLPKRSVRVFDPGNLPEDGNLSSWPSLEVRDVCRKQLLVVPICMEDRWVLFVFDIDQGCITIVDSFKGEVDHGLLGAVRQQLAKKIQLAGGAQHISNWKTQHKALERLPCSATHDFGIRILVACFELASGEGTSGENPSLQPVDTILWRAVFATMIHVDVLDDFMNIWTEKTLIVTPSNSRSEETISLMETCTESSSIKSDIDAALQLRASINHALTVHLPRMLQLSIDLAASTTQWKNDISLQIPAARISASGFRQRWDEFKESQCNDPNNSRMATNDLKGIISKVEHFNKRHRQGKVKRLREQVEAIQVMHDLHEQMRETIKRVRKYLEELEKDTVRQIGECRAKFKRVRKAEIKKKEGEAEEIKEVIIRKKAEIGKMAREVEETKERLTRKRAEITMAQVDLEHCENEEVVI